MSELVERSTALDVAYAVYDKIQPFCDNVVVVGGLRRGIAQVHDIDLVAMPNDYFGMSILLGNDYKGVKSEKTRYQFKVDGILVEIYLAKTERQFEVLKLVRTGSNTFNQNLCRTALDKNMALRYSYKEGLCGLYGAASNWDNEEKRYKMYVNPMRKIAYKEDEIIMKIMGDEKWLDPTSRNFGYEEEYDNDL